MLHILSQFLAPFVVALAFGIGLIGSLFAVGVLRRMVKQRQSFMEVIRSLPQFFREAKSEIEARRTRGPSPLRRRYSKSKSLLSPAELEFHKTLCAAVPEAAIFPKVRVADAVNATERFSGDFLRISQKHFDWLICHPDSFEPLIAIELDDASHQRNQRQIKNDETKNGIALDAGLSLLRFPWQSKYDVEKIRETIIAELNAVSDRM